MPIRILSRKNLFLAFKPSSVIAAISPILCWHTLICSSQGLNSDKTSSRKDPDLFSLKIGVIPLQGALEASDLYSAQGNSFPQTLDSLFNSCASKSNALGNGKWPDFTNSLLLHSRSVIALPWLIIDVPTIMSGRIGTLDNKGFFVLLFPNKTTL